MARVKSNPEEYAKKPLTAKQRIFVMEYIRDGNGVRAAMEAGVNKRSAGAMAAQWLDPKIFPNVVREVERHQRELQKVCELDAKGVVRELTRIALFNPKELFDRNEELKSIHDLPDDVARCLKEFKVSHRVGVGPKGEPIRVRTVEVKIHDKLEALNQLSKQLGLFKDVNVNVQQNNVTVIDWDAMTGRPASMGGAADIERRLEAERRGLLTGPDAGVYHDQRPPEGVVQVEDAEVVDERESSTSSRED